MNEKVHERVIDHIMAGIEDITGHFGHHELREKFQRLDNKYLKPILLRKSARKMRDRGFSILQVHRKLTEKDAEEYMKSNNGVFFRRNSMTTAQSILDLIRSQSECSLDSVKFQSSSHLVDTSTCGTPLDMNVLDHQSTKKSRDDSRIHHILDDAMFKPRKRFNVHQRNILPRTDTQQVFHHKSRYHLRKLLHPHYHVPKKGQFSHAHRNRKSPRTAERSKNVSFADNAQRSNGSTSHVVVNMPEIDDNQKTTAKTSKTSKASTPLQDSDGGDSDSGSSEGGIVIKFKENREEECDEGNVDDERTGAVGTEQPLSVDISAKESVESQVSPDIKPVAIELSLPWKRTIEPVPIASSVSHSMAGDDNPQMCEVPSWVDNFSYTAHTPSPKTSLLEREVSTDEEKASKEMLADSTHHIIDERQLETNSSQTLHSEPEQFRTSFGHRNESHVSVTAVRGSDPSIIPLLPLTTSIESKTNNSYTADDSLLCSGNTSNLNSSEISTKSLKHADPNESDFSLPLPWVSTSDIYTPRLSADNGSNVIPAHLPQVHTAPELFSSPDDEQLSSCHLSETNEAAVSEDNDSCIPPPWRNTSIEARTGMGVISPSASFEMDSLQPQPSSQSQRLSEVASHHSEPYLMHHHLIDLPPRPPVDYEITATLESLDIEDGQTDFMTRVQQWLLSNNPEEQDPLADEFGCPGEAKSRHTPEYTELFVRKNSQSPNQRSGDHSADETNV